MRFRQDICHVSLNKSRRNTIHGDIATGDFLSKRATKAFQASLRGGVIRLTTIARRANNRTDIHNTSGFLLKHCLSQSLAHTKDSGEIGIHHRIPVILIEAQEEIIARYAGIIHYNERRTVLRK